SSEVVLRTSVATGSPASKMGLLSPKSKLVEGKGETGHKKRRETARADKGLGSAGSNTETGLLSGSDSISGSGVSGLVSSSSSSSETGEDEHIREGEENAEDYESGPVRVRIIVGGEGTRAELRRAAATFVSAAKNR
ncbi:unnamed protein product, partial [Discosporangium mesarthrocarpum]